MDTGGRCDGPLLSLRLIDALNLSFWLLKIVLWNAADNNSGIASDEVVVATIFFVYMYLICIWFAVTPCVYMYLLTR